MFDIKVAKLFSHTHASSSLKTLDGTFKSVNNHHKTYTTATLIWEKKLKL